MTIIMLNVRCTILVKMLTLLTLMLGTSLAWAGEDRLIRLDGQVFTGRLIAVDPDGRVQWSDSAAGSLDLMGLRRIERSIPMKSTPANITLYQQGGGVLRLQSLTYQDQTMEVTGSLGKLVVPMDQVRAIMLAGDANEPNDLFTQALQATDQTQDVLLVKTDKGLQSVAGVIKAIDSEQVAILWNDQVRQVAREKIYGLVLAPVNRPAPRTGLCKITLQDGSTILAQVKQMSQDQLTLQWPNSPATIQCPWDQVARLEVASDRLVYLSDLEPVQVVQQAMLTYPWPWKRDRTVLGKPIRWGDRTYEKGLGVHAHNVLAYQMPGSFDLFSATIGLLAPESGQGDCLFVVHGDGRELFRQRMTGKDQPMDIKVNVVGVQRLSLTVEAGENFDLADHAVWADARLLRDKR